MAITLLEGFEATPLVSDYTWLELTGTATVTRSTSNVTQGTYSWEISGPDGGLLISGSPLGTATIDLSSYTTIEIDLYGTTTPADIYQFTVGAADFSGQIDTATTSGFTGSTTLTLDLTTATFDLSDVYISITIGSGPALFYIDNIRADDGGGGGGTPISVFYNHLKTQGIA